MLHRRFSRRTVGLTAFGVLASAGLRARAQTQSAAPLRDTRGREIVPGAARRIVCVGGTITETLYALGLSDRIVAVDTTSTRPPDALRDKRSVGYMRMISAEGVLSVQPDLVIAMSDAGPPAAIAQLTASSVPVVIVDAEPSPEGILARTRHLARLMNAQRAGERLCGTIEARLYLLAAFRRAHPELRRILFVMRMTNNHPMAAGTKTAADAIITLAGGINAGGGMQGYKVLDDEALVALAPDVVLTMSQGGPQIAAAIQANAGFRLTPAGRNGAIIAMEGERLLGFGPDTPEAALDLARRIAAITPP